MMKTIKKSINLIKSDIKKKELVDTTISTLITDLYQERFTEKEREKKVLLDRFLISTEGKGVVFENKIYNAK